MGFSSGYWHYFHYSDSRGYLIFCCQNVATNILYDDAIPVEAVSDDIKYGTCFFLIQKLVHHPLKYHKYAVESLESLVFPISLLRPQ